MALAVAAVVGVMAAASLRSERSQAAAVADALGRLTALDLAAELLSEEIGLAASRPLPTGSPADVGGQDEDVLPAPQLLVSLGEANSGGDALAVAFVDERLAGPAVVRLLTFEAGVDSAGDWQLYRRSGSASRQPLVEGVTGLRVVSLIDSGAPSGTEELSGHAPRRVSAVVLELRSEQVTRPLVIELPNRPLAAVEGR